VNFKGATPGAAKVKGTCANGHVNEFPVEEMWQFEWKGRATVATKP
jgi:hypothetical protein